MIIKHKRNIILFTVFIISTMVYSNLENKILTPYSENLPLAKLNGEIIKEYDVFGYPSASKNRKNITIEERMEVINDYLFKRILQKEGNVPVVINSEEYKKTYDKLIEKNAVDFYRSNLIKKNNLSEDKEISKFIKDYLDDLKKENNIKYNEELFKEISAIKAKDPDEFADIVRKKGLNKELISYKDQKVYLSRLHTEIKQIKPYHLKNLSNINVLKSLVEGQILNSILIEKAKNEGFFDKKEVKKQTEDQLKYYVADKYKEIITSDDKFIPSKDEMIDYYIENKDDDELKSKRKMWVFEIFKEYDNNDDNKENDKIKVAIELENIRQKIINGENFEKYAKFYPRPHSKDGELGFIFETDNALVGKTAAKMNEGDISDLIIQEKAISVIKVTKVQNPMLYKFEYVEDIIKRRLIDLKRKKYLEDYKKELFTKYKVELLTTKLEEKK